MSADGMPFKKRSNPLGGSNVLGSINNIREEIEAETKSASIHRDTFEPAPTKVVHLEDKKPKEPEVIREKYTATMEKNLRIDVKIASAKKGLQFSQYIEEAVKEKLEREGL